MQQVLIHVDLAQGLGPIGAWTYHDDGTLVQFYPQSLDLAISGRAREAMAGRDLDTPVTHWFHYLAQTNNNVDHYETFDADNSLHLPTILAEYRALWNTQT